MAVDPPMSDSGGFSSLLKSVQTGVKILSHLPALLQYGSVTIRQYAEKFRDPELRQVFYNIVHFGGPDLPMLTMLLPLAYAHRRMAGIPAKGWLDFARSIERRYLELGGKVEYNTRVEKLLIDNNKVTGVQLSNKNQRQADIVISAADGHFTRFALLGREEDLQNTIFQPDKVSDQPAQVNLGVRDRFAEFNGPVTYMLPTPFEAAGKLHSKITLHTRNYDSASAPVGASAVSIFVDTTYTW